MCRVVSAGQEGSHESSGTPSRVGMEVVEEERRENSCAGRK